MSSFLKNNLILLIGIPIGAAAGFLYWHQVGCATGTCPITSSPVNSTLYGALMGGLLFNTFRKDNGEIKNEKKHENESK